MFFVPAFISPSRAKVTQLQSFKYPLLPDLLFVNPADASESLSLQSCESEKEISMSLRVWRKEKLNGPATTALQADTCCVLCPALSWGFCCYPSSAV